MKRSWLTTIMSVGKDIDIKVRSSKSFPYFFWHVCSQSPFYASYSTLSAHISVFHLTSAQRNLNICFGRHSVCAHLPEGERGHAEYEHYFLVFYCMSVCYGLLLFALRFLREVHEQALSIMHWFWLQYRNAMFVLCDWVPEGKLFLVSRKLSV